MKRLSGWEKKYRRRRMKDPSAFFQAEDTEAALNEKKLREGKEKKGKELR